MNIRWDEELLSFFPDKKRNGALALDGAHDVDHEPEALLDEELEEDGTGDTLHWGNEEFEEHFK